MQLLAAHVDGAARHADGWPLRRRAGGGRCGWAAEIARRRTDAEART